VAIERRDPVPPGRYWIYLKKEELSHWEEWLRINAGKVSVVASETQTQTPEGLLWATTPTGDIIKNAVGEWILFDVKVPVPWVGFGFPTIVTDPNVRSTTDVMTAPEPEPEKYLIEEIRNLLLLAGGIYLVGSFLSRKKR
jgi:hypothetical protein